MSSLKAAASAHETTSLLKESVQTARQAEEIGARVCGSGAHYLSLSLSPLGDDVFINPLIPLLLPCP